MGSRHARGRVVGKPDSAGVPPPDVDARRRGQGRPAGAQLGRRRRPPAAADHRPPVPDPRAARRHGGPLRTAPAARPGPRLHRAPLGRGGRTPRPADRPAPRPHRGGRVRDRGRGALGLRAAQVPRAPLGAGSRFLHDDLADHLADRDPEEFVFPSRAGGPLRVGNFRRDRFDRAAVAVGLAGLVPHELRHTAASLAIASGASIKGVQSMLGHASAAMTLDRYGHLFGDELDAVAERMDAARADWMRTEGSGGGDRRSAD
ncbi:tyrosine-type recombinase/integrase [Geodermatophilus dictyosporus]|uniref:tyrosine-type recombinase/integrase n=1 Tax=Geodermatophilus dictyosporus TaxID=1523247 RepID=UPI00145C23EB|nr:tyrosine-type recombinase/integrase [Geodermatophilus dictyosporus]